MKAHTYNRSKIEMTNGESFTLSNVHFSKQGMKKNHAVMMGKNGIEYVVNMCNKFAYPATK